MTDIVIHLEPSPDGQPAGQLTTSTGHVVAFTGWLHLIRLLEDQLGQAPQPPGAGPRSPGSPEPP
jgi:hypothetical protein